MDDVRTMSTGRWRDVPRQARLWGGSSSAKPRGVDPVSNQSVDLLAVRTSDDELTLMNLDRLRSLAGIYQGVDCEDEMMALLDYCLHGKGGATPSIDTAMHGLVDATHVEHLHPESGLAVATALDGEDLTARIFGDSVVWVPWRRPGFQLGLDIARIKDANPQAIGTILGGHGITAWGDTVEECEANTLWIINTAAAYIEAHGKACPFGAIRGGFEPLAKHERLSKAAALAPTLRGIAGRNQSMVGHFTDADVVLEFLASAKAPSLAKLGTSCPDHVLRTKVRPMLLDLPASASAEDCITRLHQLSDDYRESCARAHERHPHNSAIRAKDPLIVLVPGVGMFSYGTDKRTARLGGECFVSAIFAMRGAEALSTYAPPMDEAQVFRLECTALEEAELQPKPKPLAGRIALVTGAASGIGRAIAARFAAEGACVVLADVDQGKTEVVASEIGTTDVAVGIACDVTKPEEVERAVRAALLTFGGLDIVVNNAGLSLSKPLLETTDADWDLQHNVMAKGSFLVSRAAAKVLIEQKLGGDIIYISSKNSIFAGPNNIAYAATKADQSHQVRLLAAELGEYGVRVNGINPDGVVRGSGIFSGGWGAARAIVYGVPEEQLGQYYAQRTLLKREVLPENIANAAFVLCTSDLSHTTGLHIPVDGGVAAAFLR